MTKNITMAGAASLALAALGLAACGSDRQAPQAPRAEETTPAEIAAIEKARSVEATLEQAKESRDQTLQEQENPTAQ